jgi:putative N6-adenine-specific DNA methylase
MRVNHIILLFTSLLCVIHGLNQPKSRRFFASTVKGLESVLREEISHIPGVFDIKLANCGVEYSGDDEVGFRSILWLRTSLKVMEILKSSSGITDRTSLYDFCRKIDWVNMLSEKDTFKCDTVIGRSSDELSHSHYTSLTVKNAIVDELRDALGSRPDVDIDDPDYIFHLYLDRDKASLYRLWSGSSSMHKRGYREMMHKAALRETTAAAL